MESLRIHYACMDTGINSSESLLPEVCQIHCSLGVRNGIAERPTCSIPPCRFHLPARLNAKTTGSPLEVSVVPHRLLVPWRRTAECPVNKLSDSRVQASAVRLEAHCVSGTLTISLLFSLLFLWINTGFWSLRLSIQLLQQASNKQTNKQKVERGGQNWSG